MDNRIQFTPAGKLLGRAGAGSAEHGGGAAGCRDPRAGGGALGDGRMIIRQCHHDIDHSHTPVTHAKNKIVARFIPFSVLGFWVKSTGICSGAMPYRRDFTATTRI